MKPVDVRLFVPTLICSQSSRPACRRMLEDESGPLMPTLRWDVFTLTSPAWRRSWLRDLWRLSEISLFFFFCATPPAAATAATAAAAAAAALSALLQLKERRFLSTADQRCAPLSKVTCELHHSAKTKSLQ